MHNNDERKFTATLSHIEIFEALKNGYQIDRLILINFNSLKEIILAFTELGIIDNFLIIFSKIMLGNKII